jgi:NADP-dependent 3-hydroxy acid dehydrogenase YdfG
LVARRQKELDEVADEICKINPAIKILTRAIDVRSESDVQALYGSINKEFRTVDVLINNAGSGKSVLPIRDVDPKDYWYDFVRDARSSVLVALLIC